MKRLLSIVPLLALSLGSLPAHASNASAAIAAFDEAFAKVNDYTVTVKAHEVKGDRVQDRTYHYAFKRPNFAKTDIVAGDGAGSGGVWRGGSQVHGHLKVGPFTFGKQVDVHDSKAVSLRGYTIPEGLIQNEVDKFRTIKGELSERNGPELDGVATQMLELKVADSAANDGVTRIVLYLNKATHFPVRQIRYEGNASVADDTFSELKTNVGLTDADFPF